MQANDLLKYRDEIINAFENGTFLSEHLKKKSDDAVNNYVSEVVNKDIEEIKSMEEKINLSLYEEFFESSSPANYAIMLISAKDLDKNEEFVEEKKQQNIRFRRQNKKKNE